MDQETPQLLEKKSAFITLATVLALLFVLFIVLYEREGIKIDTHRKIAEKSADIIDPFKDIKLTAQAAYVWDVNNHKALYALNADAPLPLASVTKIMMALTAIKLVPSYTVVTINKDFLAEEGDSGLFVDEAWKLSDLVNFSLVASSNDGARAIASVAGAFSLETNDLDVGREEFVRKMNEQARDIGLTHTMFRNEDGLDVSDATSTASVAGGVGSAEDMAKLFAYILKNHPEIMEATRFSSVSVNSLSNINHTAKNTNADVDKIPAILGSKTGYTELAGGNLVIAFDPYLGRPIIISVLGSSVEGRFQDVSKLVDATMNYIEYNNH